MQTLIDVYFDATLFANRKLGDAVLVYLCGYLGKEIFISKKKKTASNIMPIILTEVKKKMTEEFEKADFYVPGYNFGPSQGGKLESELEAYNMGSKQANISKFIMQEAVATQNGGKAKLDCLSLRGFNLQMEYTASQGSRLTIKFQ